ncbi:hypothetical protein K438DRAFT_1961932 [Mycena galopus ATCC 62051]|nr:hypothetical protein K438DRAFT_1961932 [Mycena galopus ATCC 62051]
MWVSDYSISEGRTRIVNLWLKRSRSCPLSIELDELPLTHPPKAFLLIEPHRPRWEYLKLNSSPSRLPVIEDSMPLLRHLELQLDNKNWSEIKEITFRQVPLLRSAVLGGAVNRVILPWAQLTSLALTTYLHQCVSVLKQTHNLMPCKLRLYGLPSFDCPTAITFPRLESLEFSDPGALCAHCYLQYFITPALRNLRIPEKFLGEDPARSLPEFTSKYGRSLQEVRITGHRSVSRTSYREALQSVPKLSFSRSYYDEMDGKEDFENGSDSDSSDTTEIRVII